MSLPRLATSEDVEAIVSYLKTKAVGATEAEAKAAVGSKLLDKRKLSAFRNWKFVDRDGDRLKLTQRGRDFSRASSDRKQSIFAEIIREQPAYLLAVEWAFHQSFEEITITDVAAHWHNHARSELGTDNEDSIREQVSCFFSVAQAAGLGTYLIGRRGQTTRLVLNKDALGQFIGETGFLETTVESDEENQTIISTSAVSEEEIGASQIPDELRIRSASFVRGAKLDHLHEEDEIKVFISHSKNMDIVDQIKTMMEVSDIDYEVAVEEETTAIPVPEKVLAGMRRCNAAVISVTADEQSRREDGKYSVNENVLIEIGAAFVLYDKKVVLVWDRRLSVPSNLQGLYRCEFEGNELSWTAGMKLMKAVRNFKKAPQ